MKMTTDIAYFLGLWIAEGSVEQDIGRVTITCGDSDVGDVLTSGAVFGVKFKNSAGRPDQWRGNSYALVEAMRFLKMPLVKAPQKWLPDFVWSGKREWAQHLLSGMFDGDGYVCTQRNKAGYTTASKQLAQDVQLLLTNFGVMSRLSCVRSMPTEKSAVESDQYRVEIIGKNCSLLKEVLQLRIKRKAEALAQVPDTLFSRRDGVPVLALLCGLKAHFVGKKLGKLEKAIGIAKQVGSDTTYETLRLILSESSEAASTPEYKLLEKIVADHYYWDEVTSVTEGESQTYDFTIPDTHSFWSNGFISHNTPKSYNALYRLWEIGQRGTSKAWASWQFPTITSPFIPKSEIEAAREDMDAKSFNQEFNASFESMSGRVYYAFDRKVHVKPLEFNPVLPIWIGQDFNIDPMSSVVFQMQRNGELWAVDEICLANSNTQELCDELERRYWRYLEQIIIYPDPAGAYRGHQRGESDLDIFRERGFKKQKFRRKHPPVSDRINAVNRMLTSADGKVRMYVDPRCKKLIEALEQTLYLPGGREVDKTRGIEHAADAAGYCIEFEFPLRKFEILGLSI